MYVDPCCVEFILGKYKNRFKFSILSQLWNGAGSGNSSLWQGPVCLAYSTALLLMIWWHKEPVHHYGDVIMGTTASQITSLRVVYSTVYSDADLIKHQSSASLAFVRGIHRGPVNSPHKWPVTQKMFPFDDVIMINMNVYHYQLE